MRSLGKFQFIGVHWFNSVIAKDRDMSLQSISIPARTAVPLSKALVSRIPDNGVLADDGVELHYSVT